MEWVETTGKSIEAALDSALDQLGVDETDAEYEVVSEPKVGLFGRLKNEARIRARVRPTAPPSKDSSGGNRRRRSGRGDRESKGAASRSGDVQSSSVGSDAEPVGESSPKNVARQRSRSKSRHGADAPKSQGAKEMVDQEVALEEQGEVASSFLSGLMSKVNVPVSLSVKVDNEDDTATVSLTGDNLGAFIGPKGATLQSLQELTRIVVQRKTGARNGRLLVDVGDYRVKRRDALERFSKQIAEELLANGGVRTLEPMNSADRKVVHDTINGIAGVSTSSEGEEPRRYVVIRSDSAS
jgi:spoIIIJ-associated protein